MLGMAYHDGIGVPANERRAVFWYRRGAQQGDPWAKVGLAKCLLNGEGVRPNRNAAKRLLEEAAPFEDEARRVFDEFKLQRAG